MAKAAVAVYDASRAPWDIGRPQPAFVEVADRVGHRSFHEMNSTLTSSPARPEATGSNRSPVIVPRYLGAKARSTS